MKTFKIHFLRHALTAAGEEGRFAGITDEDISEEGREEILNMAKTENYPRVDAVFSSPLKRATQTASLIYPDLDVQIIPDLSEFDFGEFEGQTLDELLKDERFLKFMEGKLDTAPGGENQEEFYMKIENALLEIIDEIMDRGYRSTAIVAHAGIISYFLAKFIKPETRPNEWSVPFAGGYSVLVQPILWEKYETFELYDEISFHRRETEIWDEDKYMDYAESLITDADLKER